MKSPGILLGPWNGPLYVRGQLKPHLLHDKSTPVHLQNIAKRLGVHCMSTFKNNSLLIDSWKCKMPHKCLIIWTVCAFHGKETADERWSEQATEVNAQWVTLACSSQQSWVSCWHRPRRTHSQNLAAVSPRKGSQSGLGYQTFSLGIQKKGDRVNLHHKNSCSFSQARKWSAKDSKPWGLQLTHACAVRKDPGVIKRFPEYFFLEVFKLLTWWCF